MSVTRETSPSTSRGRPAQYLLSGIATCGVCGAAVRIGSQNTGLGKGQPARYRVYECAGLPGAGGFHVSIQQEHLDQIVTEAVMDRVLQADFHPPRDLEDDADGTERRALRLQIKAQRLWLDHGRKEAHRRGMDHIMPPVERIVRSKIEAAQLRIDELERLNPLVLDLQGARSVRLTWQRLPRADQRRVIGALMAPRINPVPIEQRGRGLNSERIDLGWLS